MLSVLENTFSIPSFVGEGPVSLFVKKRPPKFDFNVFGTTSDFEENFEGSNEISAGSSIAPTAKGLRVSDKWSFPSFFICENPSPKLISTSPSSPSAFWKNDVFNNEFLSFVVFSGYPKNLFKLIGGNLLSLTFTSTLSLIYYKPVYFSWSIFNGVFSFSCYSSTSLMFFILLSLAPFFRNF